MLLTKKDGFTLGEVLLAVFIVGVIAVLSLPSLNKDINEKSRMSLLKGTVSTISDVVQMELTKSRTTEIQDTDIYKNPQMFMKKFKGTKSGAPFASSYKRYSDSKVISDILIPSNDKEGQAVLLLANGVGVGLVNDEENSRTSFVIDVTGADKPNMVGVDYFIVKLALNDGNGCRAGDITSYTNGGAEGVESGSGLKDSCLAGNGAACYRMVELSGFDPKYLD